MIELVQVGKCENCPNVSPKVTLLYAAGGMLFQTTVTCEHQELCDHIEDHLIEFLKEESTGG